MTTEPAGQVTDLDAEALRQELEDLRQALDAIRGGEVDAVVVGGPQGEQLYTQVNADRPYRVIVEEMGDGALTVSERGTVLYANQRMAQLLRRPRSDLLGLAVTDLVDPAVTSRLAELLTVGPGTTRRAELDLSCPDGTQVPVLASVAGLELDGAVVRCLIAADLTEQRQAVAAISQARQEVLRQTAALAEEHRVKESLQRAVLPARLPEGRTFELAARYLPADQPSLVGGDWYDAFVLPDGAVALAVGDVVGHDLDAAATMGQMRNALRAYAHEGGPPASVLGRLNRLVDGLADGGMATVAFGVLDPAEGTFRWAGAGHPPPLLIRADGARLLSPPVGMMLGADPAASYADVVVPLDVGDLLVLYSDGLIERRNSDLDADLGALVAAAHDLTGTSAEAVCSALLARLAPTASHDDDICLLVVGLPG